MVVSTGLGAVWPRPQRLVFLMFSAMLSRRSMSPSSPVAGGDALEDLEHALGAEAAGDALAAALVLGELQEVPGEVDHAGGVVGDDHAAGADDGAGRGQALVVDRRVEQARRHAAAGRAAELHGLELLAVLDAAADVEDDVAERGAHGHLGEAAVDDLAGEAEGLGALARVVAEGGVGGRPVGDDPGHVGPGLDVVDVGGLAPEAADAPGTAAACAACRACPRWRRSAPSPRRRRRRRRPP